MGSLSDIVKRLISLNKTNSSSDDIAYLDVRDFQEECGPLVRAINDAVRTMEKRAEARLKADRKRIKSEIERRVREKSQADVEETLAGARLGIWSIEAEKGKTPRMYGDKTMQMLLGIEDEDLTPEEMYHAWYDRIETGYYDMVDESVAAMESGKRGEVVYPWNHPKIGQIYVRCGGMRDKFDKPGFRLKGYHQDVTETMTTRKKQERAMFEAIVEAKKANAAKTEFISNMSHDIRTPINGILGMLTIAERCASDSEKQKECRRKVRMAAEHLLSLINDVLDISKIESGTITLGSEPFNIHELVDNSMSIVGPQSEESGITLKRSYDGIVHPCLVGSPLHLRQILINVIGNGIKYNKNGGYVSILTEEIPQKDAGRGELFGKNENRVLYRFTIEDNGIGMSSAFLTRLFEPFTQEGKDARTNYRGTGLGMAITKGLVEQMGGTIEVHSIEGEGTKIIIELPFSIGVCKTREEKEAEGSGESTDISGMTILLAEDNDLNREITEYMLRDAGAKVINATNGKEAYDIFIEKARSKGDKIDLILMDVMMPVMDGLEATKMIRASASKGARDVPIVTLSANAFTEDAQKAKDAGMNAYLTKPLDTEKMLRTIASFRK